MKDFYARNKFLLKLMFLASSGGICIGVSHFVIILYAIKLGANPSQIGLIRGVQGIGILLMVLPIGILIDHYGPKRLFEIGGIAAALVYLFVPFARTPQTLMIFMAILGLFMSFRFVSMNSIFLDYLNDAGIGNGKAGWYRGANSIGLVLLGPLIGSYLVKYAGYTKTFILVSISFLFTVIIARTVLSDKGKDDTTLNIFSLFSFNKTSSHLKPLFKNKELIEASLAETLAIAAFSCFNTFIVVIVLRIFHLSEHTAALFVSTQGALYILALFTLDVLLRKIGQKNFYLSSICLIILALILLGGAGKVIWLWFGSIFLGTGLGMLNMVNVSRLAKIDGKKGKISGFFMLFTMVGGMFAPMAGGFIGSTFGLQTIFWVLVPLYFALGLKIINGPLKEEKVF